MPAVPVSVNPYMAVADRAQRDFAYCCGELLWFKPKAGGPLQKLALNWPQRYIWQKYLQPAWDAREPLALLCLKARREGVSTLMRAWSFQKATFFRGQSCYLTAHDDDTSQELFRMDRTFYQNLPQRLRPPVVANNRMEIEYGPEWGGSSLRVRVAKFEDIGHGKTIQHWHGSEVALYPIDRLSGAPAALPGLLEAVPTTGRSSIVWETTAVMADTWFHQVWLEAERNKSRRVGYGNRHWQTVFLPWFYHADHEGQWLPEYAPLDKEETEIQQRFKLSLSAMAWRRGKIEELNVEYPGQGHRKFLQSYPATSAEPFLLAGSCVFPDEALDEMLRQERPPSLGFQIVRTGQWRCNLVEEKHLDAASLLVWEPPRQGCEYALGVVVSRGVGRDDSAVVVMRMPGYHMVAHWNDNFVAPKQLAYMVASIARYYAVRSGSHPICTVELNDAGILVNSELEAMRAYEPIDIFVWEYWDKVGQQMSTKTGWMTTYRSKELLLGLANSLMLARQTFQPSHLLREDMGRTIEIRAGVARTSGCDLTIAWLLALMTAYRKIARFHDPEGVLDLGKGEHAMFSKSFASDDAAEGLHEAYGEDYVYKDRVFYDTKGDKIRRGVEDNSIMGSGALW